MADLTRGVTFNDGGVVNASSLGLLVSQMRITNVDRESINQAKYSAITRQIVEITDAYEKEIWALARSTDATDDYNDVDHLLIRMGSSWRPGMNLYIPVFNAGATDLNQGHLVMPANQFALRDGVFVDIEILDGTVTVYRERCCGVLIDSVAAGGYGVAAVKGVAVVNTAVLPPDDPEPGEPIAPSENFPGMAQVGPVRNGGVTLAWRDITIMGTLLSLAPPPSLALIDL